MFLILATELYGFRRLEQVIMGFVFVIIFLSKCHEPVQPQILMVRHGEIKSWRTEKA